MVIVILSMIGGLAEWIGMISCFNCPITGVQLQLMSDDDCTEWIVKNEAANAPIIFEEFVVVMINVNILECKNWCRKPVGSFLVKHIVSLASGLNFSTSAALYSKEDKHPLSVKFTNKAGKKVKLFWINKRGRRKRKGNIKEGQSKTVDTYETHVFMAFNRKLSREPLPINGSPVFYVFPHKHGDKHVEVEIKKPSGMALPCVTQV